MKTSSYSGSGGEVTFVICKRLQELGYARERHIRLYGDIFFLTSDPVCEGEAFAVEGISRKSGELRRIRIPLPIVHTLRQEFTIETELEAVA